MWKNLRDLVFGGLLSKVLLGLSTIFLIKTLSKSDYALVNNFLFIQSLVSGLIFSPFLSVSVVQSNLHKVFNTGRLYGAFNLLQTGFVGLVLVVSASMGSNLSTLIFRKPDFYPSFMLGLVASIFLTFQNIILSQHQTSESFRKYNLINILRPVFLIISLSALYFTDFLNFWTASLSFLISIFLSVAGDVTFLKSAFNLSGWRMKWSQFTWFWNLSKVLILFFFVRGSVDHVATFLVSRYFSLDDFANFSVAFRYYAMVDLIIFSAHIAFLNSFTKKAHQESRKSFLLWLKTNLPVVAVGLVLLVFGKEIFVWVNGERYADSYPLFVVYMLGIAVYLCFSPVIYGLAKMNRFSTLLILSLIGLFLQILISWVGLHFHSLIWLPLGAVVARGFIYIVSTIIYFRAE